MASYDIYGETWERHDGKRVLIDGRSHRIKVSVYTAVYPCRRQEIMVHAEPVNKGSKYYRKVRSELGDDWSTDVLESDVELQAEILNQLEMDEMLA